MIAKYKVHVFILLFVYSCGFSQEKSFVDVVKELPKDYVNNANRDYTDVLQNFIDANDSILLPNYTMLINDTGLRIGSNKTVVFQPKSKLVLQPSDTTHYNMFLIKNARNIKIYGANLVGDRDIHKGSKGEWGMGIRIDGGTNILIENANISKCWGDGINIRRSERQNSKNIEILNSIFKRNRRNGISIISGADILIKNSSFIDTDGTLPMAGIDIEPVSNKDDLGLIEIKDINTSLNRIGIQVSMMHFPSEKKKEFEINIESVNSQKDQHGLLIRDFYRIETYGAKAIPLQGIVTYNNIIIKNSIDTPIKFFNNRKGYEYGPKYIFKNIHIENDRVSLKRKNKIKLGLQKRGFDVRDFFRKK